MIAVLETVLAGLNVDPSLRDAIAGDLLEERAVIAAAYGEHNAERWVRSQVLRSLPALVMGEIRTGGFRLFAATLSAAALAMLAVGISIALTVAVFSRVMAPETFQRFAVVALLIDLAFGAAGGNLAARFGRSAPLGAAFIFGMLAVLLTAAFTGHNGGWYFFALQSLLVPATLTGGWLRARHLARR
jgi:hypothetical protein